jgi:hypothetical protein
MAVNVTDPALWYPFHKKPVQRRTSYNFDMVITDLRYLQVFFLYCSKQGKSNHQLWNELCDMISKNPHKIKTLNVDAIIRGGLRRYTDQVNVFTSLYFCYCSEGSGSCS